MSNISFSFRTFSSGLLSPPIEEISECIEYYVLLRFRQAGCNRALSFLKEINVI
jgi:hypothetical protein